MNFNIKCFKPHKLSIAVAATLVVAGCGGSGQDDGSVSSRQTTFSGVTIDGALARATVYLDSNNNATRDPWEDYAFTDNDGYYSFNPKTNTDYCAADAPPAEKIYCLQSSRSFSNVVVRVDGGYDLLTGEPFLGQMSRRIELEDESSTLNSVVSPLTSLMTNLESSEDRTNVLTALQIQENDLDVNYLDADGEGAIDSGLLNKALKVHKTVTILSDRLNDNYEELNNETGVMNDPSGEVYRNMARELITNSSNGLDYVLKNSESLTRIMDNSESVLRELYESKELDLPQDMGSESNPGQFTRVVNVASSVPDVVDQLLNSQETFSFEQAVGSARALESFVIKSVNEGDIDDASIDAAVNFFTSEETENLVDALTSALSSELADVTSLSTNDFSGDDFDSEEEIQSVAVLPPGTNAFGSMTGLQIKVSDLDLGTSNSLNDNEFELYFDGSEGGIAGTFTGCFKFIEDALPDGTLGDGNTRGELVSGFWSMLGATESNRTSYSLLLTLEFLGATYQAIMKTIGPTTIEGVEYEQIRFDNSGDYKVYHSENGIVETVYVPVTYRECEQNLPSRVGI